MGLICWLAAVVCAAGGGEAAITLDPSRTLGDVNPWVFGDGQLGYDPVGLYIFDESVVIDDNTCYGAGLWDPEARRSVEKAIALARDRGITISRFPGGCGVHHYDWKATVGPVEDRPKWRFGVAEFLQTCADMGAEPVITLSYFVGGPRDSADLVEYLNAPDDGSHPWAARRAAQGYPEPFGVTYFEFGNECFHTPDHKGLVDPREYVDKFNRTAEAMKAVDPRVKLGAVAFNDEPLSEWNRVVFAGVRDRADFIVEHSYPVSLDYYGKTADVAPETLFAATLAAPLQVERNYRRLNRHIRERTGRSDLPLAITEYNASFLGDDPVPYRFSLGTALMVADLLRVMLQPEANVLMANYHHFINETFGEVKGPVKGEAGDYILRPAYWVFWLYRHHFGSQIVPVDVRCNAYEFPGGFGVIPAAGAGREEAEFLSDDLAAGRAFESKELPGAALEVRDGRYKLTFAPELDETYNHARMVVPDIKPGATYRVSADVRYSRDIWGGRIYLGDARGEAAGHPGSATFSPLPRTGVWTPQHADYTAAADAEALEVVLIRTPGGPTGAMAAMTTPDPPQTETFEVRNLRVRQVLPERLPAVPYLSANAGRSPDGRTVFLMVVNKNLREAIDATVTVKGVSTARVRQWTLTGPSVEATNESRPDTVAVIESPVRDVEIPFKQTFAPHSLTALEISLP